MLFGYARASIVGQRAAPSAFDVAGTVCGDGTILAGTFAQTARGGILPDPVQQWLTASGWDGGGVAVPGPHMR